MTSRQRVNNAIAFLQCDRIPTERDDVLNDGLPYTYGKGRGSGLAGEVGIYTDAWGCIWKCAESGVTGEVKQSPFMDGYKNLEEYTAPYDVLEAADLSRIDTFCDQTDKFVVPMWETSYNLFERMQHLRGTENLFVDLALDLPEIYVLRNKIHAYFMEQAKLWCETKIDALHISDDWGTQISLLISPEKWRQFFKPMYLDYIALAHSYGKRVIMHSDGFIEAIMTDLVEIGLDALNAQLFCMDIEKLAERYNHKLAFWGEIDRQNILPRGSVQECREAVRRVAAAYLKYGKTGIVGQCFAGKDISELNRQAVYDEWLHISEKY